MLKMEYITTFGQAMRKNVFVKRSEWNDTYDLCWVSLRSTQPANYRCFEERSFCPAPVNMGWQMKPFNKK